MTAEQSERDYISCLPKDIIKICSRMFVMRLWMIVAPALLLIAAGVFCDIRVSIIGLMLIFIVMPMAMTLSVFKCLGSKWSAVNLAPKTVDIGPDMIKITPAEGYRLPAGVICWDDVRRISFQRQSYVLKVGKALTDCLILPSSMLGDEQKAIIESRMLSEDAMKDH